MKTWLKIGLSLMAIGFGQMPARSATNVYLTEVPDYDWWAGCFGTASGNLMGFWDRHGFPDFYTGPTANGVAPLNNYGPNAGIISMWASQAGVDGRPANQYGHYDDYYVGYESTDLDPYLTAKRPEHTPDCIGDFIGLSQLKWANMAGECDGNIDGFCFLYWDNTGEKRTNYVPSAQAGLPARDLQSGLRAWTQYRGYDCLVFSQLADFNPDTPPGKGFTFADLKAEIDAGYPVLLFLQSNNVMSRPIDNLPRANPELHGMLAYGYYVSDNGGQYVRYRTSWASGDNRIKQWSGQPWEAEMPVRGVIGFHPLPKLNQCLLANGSLTLSWNGPTSMLFDVAQSVERNAQGFVVEMARSLSKPDFTPVSPVILSQSYTVTNCPSPAYFRIKVTAPR
jgi:hypothetical protein